jgi:hypothetical protein
LLYIATLYKDLQAAYQQLIIIECANNTNLLAVSSIFENIKNLLKAAQRICKKWLQKTGMEFAFEKSELLHFSRAYANCELLLRLRAVIMRSIINARFLKV